MKYQPSQITGRTRPEFSKEFVADKGLPTEGKFSMRFRKISYMQSIRVMDMAADYAAHYGAIKGPDAAVAEYIFLDAEPILFTSNIAIPIITLAVAQSSDTIAEDRYSWEDLLRLAAKDDGLMLQFTAAAGDCYDQPDEKKEEDDEGPKVSLLLLPANSLSSPSIEEPVTIPTSSDGMQTASSS